MSDVKHVITNWDQSSTRILEKNLHDFFKQERTNGSVNVRDRCVMVHELLREKTNNNIPRGVTRIYTGRINVQVDIRRAYKLLAESKYADRFAQLSKEEQINKAKQLAAWNECAEKAMYDIYKDLMRMWKVGVQEFYGQYAPHGHRRHGGMADTGQFTISGKGVNTKISATVEGPGYTYTTSWSGRYINAEAETWFMVHGMRLMGGATAFPASAEVPTSWSFSYGSSILGGYIAGTMLASLENVINNIPEIAYNRALRYFGAMSALFEI